MPDTRLYEADFYAWTEEQAALLRRMAEERVNTRLDLENLAEEVTDLGNNVLEVVEGNLVQVVVHLLKLEWSPQRDPRNHWTAELAAFRGNALRRLERAPSARKRVDLGRVYRDAVRIVRPYFGGIGMMPDFLIDCPYTIDEMLDHDYLPENRHGLP